MLFENQQINMCKRNFKNNLNNNIMENKTKSGFLTGVKLIYTLVVVLILHMTINADNCEGQWQTDFRLTNTPDYSSTSYNGAWCIAASGSVLHVVWVEDLSGNGEIFYKRSTDAGQNWEGSIRLTNNVFLSEAPSVAVSGNFVNVVWFDHRDGNTEIYYKRSTDAGVNWGADTRMTNNTAQSYFPSIAVSNNNVHIVWEDYRDGNVEIYYKYSSDGGQIWGTDTRLTNDTSSSEHPSISLSDLNVHVVWYDNRNGNSEIYYKRSTNGGISWGADTRLTNNTDISIHPTIASSGSNVHVGWQEYRDGNPEIYTKRSTDGGVNWASDTRLTNNSAFSYYPSFAVSGNLVHAVWQDLRDGNWEIYYKSSLNSGVNWGTDIRLTNNIADSYSPSVAISGFIVHAVWNDNRDANNEIYYKRDPTGNPTEIINTNLEIPITFSLKQNYPNPFNPSTIISFQLPVNSQVSLKVFDVMGREVQTIVNDRLQAGTYESTFDGSGLNSGVYIYKLMTDGFTKSKRMLLVK